MFSANTARSESLDFLTMLKLKPIKLGLFRYDDFKATDYR